MQIDRWKEAQIWLPLTSAGDEFPGAVAEALSSYLPCYLLILLLGLWNLEVYHGHNERMRQAFVSQELSVPGD